MVVRNPILDFIANHQTHTTFSWKRLHTQTLVVTITVTLPNNTGELGLRDAIILDASASSTDEGADLLQNTSSNENDRILLEDAMTGDTGGFLSGHDFNFTGSDITVGGSFGIPIDKGFTLGGSTKWTIECSSADNDLDLKFNGTTVLKIASNGALTSNNDLTAFGTP